MSVLQLINELLPPWAVPTVIAICGFLIAKWRLPSAWNYVKTKGLALLGQVAPGVSGNVTELLDSMVASLPDIEDPELHKKAVDACVQFSEAIIREAGLQAKEEPVEK